MYSFIFCLFKDNKVTVFPFCHFFLSLTYTFKEDMSDSVTNYYYVGNTKVSVSIRKTNAH